MENQKKLIEPNPCIDVYSFGLIMWEIWHEHSPFDNDLAMAINYVVKENSRPMINSEDNVVCNEDYSNLIRQCW